MAPATATPRRRSPRRASRRGRRLHTTGSHSPGRTFRRASRTTWWPRGRRSCCPDPAPRSASSAPAAPAMKAAPDRVLHRRQHGQLHHHAGKLHAPPACPPNPRSRNPPRVPVGHVTGDRPAGQPAGRWPRPQVHRELDRRWVCSPDSRRLRSVGLAFSSICRFLRGPAAWLRPTNRQVPESGCTSSYSPFFYPARGAVHRVVTGLVVMLWPWLTCWLSPGSSSSWWRCWP